MTTGSRTNLPAALALATLGCLILLPGQTMAGVEDEVPPALALWLNLSVGASACVFLALVLSVALGRGWGPRGPVRVRTSFGPLEVVGGFAAGIVLAHLASLALTVAEVAGTGARYGAQCVVNTVLASAVFWLWTRGPKGPQPVPPVRPGTLPRDLLWGAGFGLAMVLLVGSVGKTSQTVLDWLGRAPDLQGVVEQVRDETDVVTLGLAFAYAVVFAPLWEEVLFRGLLYAALKRLRDLQPLEGARPTTFERALLGTVRFLGRPWSAAVVSGIVFGAIHGSLYAFVPLAVLGTALARLYERNGSLAAPMAAHAIFNAVQLVGIRLLPSGAGG